MLWRIVMFMLLVSLITGYTESLSRLKAAIIPPACPQYECRTVHAFWTGQKTYVWGVHVTNKNDNADDGVTDIFTTNSVEKKPTATDGTTVDWWDYPTCTPFCGKDANGKWQAYQEVLTSGTKNKQYNVNRAPCTANGGAEGPKINPPVNANTDGNTPPGN
jgi:hypothetical protein